MPVTEIAFASGFASVRQFNASFREVYGWRPPRCAPGCPGHAGPGPACHCPQTCGSRTAEAEKGKALMDRARPARGPREDAADGTWLALRLTCREPFDGRSLLRFLAARAIPGWRRWPMAGTRARSGSPAARASSS